MHGAAPNDCTQYGSGFCALPLVDAMPMKLSYLLCAARAWKQPSEWLSVGGCGRLGVWRVGGLECWCGVGWMGGRVWVGEWVSECNTSDASGATCTSIWSVRSPTISADLDGTHCGD
jgi:hypothetical protein